jgi:hypothetical protein
VVKVVAVGENIYTIEELRQAGEVSLIYMNRQWDPTMGISLTINEASGGSQKWSEWLVAGRDNRAASTD